MGQSSFSAIGSGKDRLIIGAQYAIAFVIPTAILIFFSLPLGTVEPSILTDGDFLFFETQISSAGQVGPLATNLHLNWPLGTNSWSVPQSGLLILILSWLINGVLGASVLTTYYLVYCLSAGLAGLSILYFLRSIHKNGIALSILSTSLAVLIAGSLFPILKLVHPNVDLYFLVPLTFGAVIRMATSKSMWNVALLFFAALLSPLWWSVVAIFLLIFSLPATLFSHKSKSIRIILLPALVVSLGTAPQLALSYLHGTPGSASTRGAWDSNIYGGHLTDLIASAWGVLKPLHLWEKFSPGTSIEGNVVGTLGGILGLLSMFMLISAFPIKSDSKEIKFLATFTTVTVALFLLGGLGNLQAALFVLFGQESPARVWSRLIIILVVLGAAWLQLIFLQTQLTFHNQGRGKYFQILSALLVVCIIGLTLLDYRKVEGIQEPVPLSNLPESSAISYISEHLKPCPIAQLPLDSTPSPLIVDWKQTEKFYYRSYIPYLLLPDFYWTYGDITGNSHLQLADLGTEISSDQVRELGYCAVLFDKEAASLSKEQSIDTSGIVISSTESPSFSSPRYDVYLLGGK